jgi:hypothetical protein
VSATRALLAAIDRLPEAQRVEVRAGVPADLLAQLDAALSVAWFPARLHHVVADRSLVVLGDEADRALWRDVFLALVRGPLLRAMADTALRLFGTTPRALARWAPRSWGLVTRGLGTIIDATEDDPQRATLAMEGYPPELAAAGSYVTGLAGTFEGFFTLTHTAGNVQVTRADTPRGAATFELTWR